jgi:hypothetical protein
MLSDARGNWRREKAAKYLEIQDFQCWHDSCSTGSRMIRSDQRSALDFGSSPNDCESPKLNDFGCERVDLRIRAEY